MAVHRWSSQIHKELFCFSANFLKYFRTPFLSNIFEGLGLEPVSLTHFAPLFQLYAPWKCRKTSGNLIFSGGFAMKQFPALNEIWVNLPVFFATYWQWWNCRKTTYDCLTGRNRKKCDSRQEIVFRSLIETLIESFL